MKREKCGDGAATRPFPSSHISLQRLPPPEASVLWSGLVLVTVKGKEWPQSQGINQDHLVDHWPASEIWTRQRRGGLSRGGSTCFPAFVRLPFFYLTVILCGFMAHRTRAEPRFGDHCLLSFQWLHNFLCAVSHNFLPLSICQHHIFVLTQPFIINQCDVSGCRTRSELMCVTVVYQKISISTQLQE